MGISKWLAPGSAAAEEVDSIPFASPVFTKNRGIAKLNVSAFVA
jgi:hypothetical protein